jgi:hydroxyacylglutathione hydrolase
MIIERIWAANSLRNFHYLIGCAETGEALAIDPLNWQACLARAQARNWRITQIVNTHEHPDHTAGNAALVAATGATVLAHRAGAAAIGGVDRGLSAGDVIRVGKSVELECLDTPGHTMAHVCLLAHADGSAIFSGDTLFNAGVGNCRNGGDPGVMYETCSQLLERLPASTRIYPGHDYLQNNLAFSLSVEPGNSSARHWQERCKDHDPERAPVLTLQQEREINSFFRLGQAGLIEGLRAKLPGLPARPAAREVFLALRELRNHW